MAALEDIKVQSCQLADLSHGEVDVYIYKLDLLWKSLFQLHFDSNVDSYVPINLKLQHPPPPPPPFPGQSLGI